MGGSLSETLIVVAAVGLGLSAGALLAEGAVLVPFWKSLEPPAFLAWYRRHASLLLRFFGPLEVVPTALVIAATAAALATGRSDSGLLVVASVLAVAVLGSFPLYFRGANQSFEDGSLGAENVAAELRRWSSWHWARTGVAIAAFFASLLALAGG